MQQPAWCFCFPPSISVPSWLIASPHSQPHPIHYSEEHVYLLEVAWNSRGWPEGAGSRFIGRPQTFVELQLHFKLHFYTRKMQFETQLELHKRLWTTNELTTGCGIHATSYRLICTPECTKRLHGAHPCQGRAMSCPLDPPLFCMGSANPIMHGAESVMHEVTILLQRNPKKRSIEVNPINGISEISF